MENPVSLPRATTLSVVTLSLCAGLAGGVWASAAFWFFKARAPPAEVVQRSECRPALVPYPVPAPPAPSALPAVPPPPAPDLAPEQCPHDPMIRWANGRYEIDRARLERRFSDNRALAPNGRIVPSIRDGKPNGFKIYAVAPCSLQYLFGFRNADLVMAVNGMSMATPDLALEAYTKLRTARDFTVQVERRGVVIELRYHLN